MPVLTRGRTAWALIAAAIAVTFLLAAGAALISILVGQSCSGESGSGDAPSQLAQHDIPANFLRIYEQVGAKYNIPWEILAAIWYRGVRQRPIPRSLVHADPQSTRPGVANFAGASGPMAIGVGGAAGDAYDALRHYLPAAVAQPATSARSIRRAMPARDGRPMLG